MHISSENAKEYVARNARAGEHPCACACVKWKGHLCPYVHDSGKDAVTVL